jgi:protein-tyrosine phosphatase
MFGQYPTSPGTICNPIENLIKTGRNVFVNVTCSHERWNDFDYVPYVTERVDDPVFVEYPITDGRAPQDPESFKQLMIQLHSLFKEGKRLYIHCFGGHGRCAVVTGCLLIHLGYQPEETLKLLKEAHGTRSKGAREVCPQTAEQIRFIQGYKT